MMSRFFLVAQAMGLSRPATYGRHWDEHTASEEGAFTRALTSKRHPFAPVPWTWL
ncbi:hypothetical protein [Pararhodospirillum photometricum]|uniref:hypothetical protein n=1 Tax=Pararhodospirillum photometricum TaxID=1084 RepID=UPI00031C0341|nr:hypothetical protein [Pararhodospirillum photometricum]